MPCAFAPQKPEIGNREPLIRTLFRAFADEPGRLPELFCGFPRRPGQGPTLYPVACAPQAWAAGAVLLILEACLGIRIQASPPRVLFRHTVMPQALPKVEIRNLKVGSATVDFAVERKDVHLRTRLH